MNNDDTIAGSFPNHHKTSGYILDIDNNLTSIDATPATNWTNAVGINNRGVVVGNYIVPNTPGWVNGGYIRNEWGKIKLLAIPQTIGGIKVGPAGLFYNGINDYGVTVGAFLDVANKSYGFVRDVAGKFTLIQYPNTPVTAGVMAVNNDGALVGNFMDAIGVEHGLIVIPAVH